MAIAGTFGLAPIPVYTGKMNTDKWYPVLLTDTTDDQTGEASIADTAVDADYSIMSASGAFASYSVTSSDWKEIGEGVYALRIGAGEFTSAGMYVVRVGDTSPAGHKFVFAVDVTAVTIDDIYSRIGAPAGASVSADIAAVKVDTAATLVDTNELQTDLTNGGRLDLILDATLADTNEVQTDLANGGRLDLLIDSILADTNELQTDITNGGRIDLLIDSILADTNELQTDWTNGGRLDALIDSILADTNALDTDWANGGRLDLLLDATLADTNELQTDWVNGGRLDLIIDAVNTSATSILAATGSNSGGVKILLSQTISEGQTARTIGGSLEAGEAAERNKVVDNGVSGTRVLYRADGSTPLITRTRSDANTLTP